MHRNDNLLLTAFQSFIFLFLAFIVLVLSSCSSAAGMESITPSYLLSGGGSEAVHLKLKVDSLNLYDDEYEYTGWIEGVKENLYFSYTPFDGSGRAMYADYLASEAGITDIVVISDSVPLNDNPFSYSAFCNIHSAADEAGALKCAENLLSDGLKRVLISSSSPEKVVFAASLMMLCEDVPWSEVSLFYSGCMSALFENEDVSWTLYLEDKILDWLETDSVEAEKLPGEVRKKLEG